MPFTPFHFGLGILFKGAAPRRVSFSAFALTQIAIDFETAANIVRGHRPVHGSVHTLPVATAVGIAVGLATAAIGGRITARRARPQGPGWRAESLRLPALIGGALGGASHPLLDAVIHRDVTPFAPFTYGNPLLGWVGPGAVTLTCVACGVAGYFLLRRPPQEPRAPEG